MHLKVRDGLNCRVTDVCKDAKTVFSLDLSALINFEFKEVLEVCER